MTCSISPKLKDDFTFPKDYSKVLQQGISVLIASHLKLDFLVNTNNSNKIVSKDISVAAKKKSKKSMRWFKICQTTFWITKLNVISVR